MLQCTAVLNADFPGQESIFSKQSFYIFDGDSCEYVVMFDRDICDHVGRLVSEICYHMEILYLNSYEWEWLIVTVLTFVTMWECFMVTVMNMLAC